MAEFRDRQIRKIVAHAYAKVPYYRRLFDEHGIAPRDIRGMADLGRIPVTTRQDLQRTTVSDQVAEGVDPSKLIVRRTTGSTGEPLSVRRTWTEEQILNFARFRALRSYGLRWSDIIAVPRIPVPHHPRDHYVPRLIADAFHFYRKTLVDVRADLDAGSQLCESQPEVVMGWPSVLSQVADQWRAASTKSGGKCKPPRFILSGGEMLTPSAKRHISETFGAPVYDMVGAHEFSLVAWECGKTGAFHLSDETIAIEILTDGRPAKPGEAGVLVGTTLHSFAMPFIRYRLGDVVTRGDDVCGCGQPYSTITTINGRIADQFPLPHGRVIHPQDIARVAAIAANWIRQLQVVQESAEHMTLRFATLRQPDETEMAKLRAELESLLGSGVKLDIVLVPELLPGPDGKFRVFQSNARGVSISSTPAS